MTLAEAIAKVLGDKGKTPLEQINSSTDEPKKEPETKREPSSSVEPKTEPPKDNNEIEELRAKIKELEDANLALLTHTQAEDVKSTEELIYGLVGGRYELDGNIESNSSN